MKNIASRLAIASTALLLAAGAALAQTNVTTTTTRQVVTPDQEKTIYTTITRQQSASIQAPPADWSPSVGVVVPQTVELYPVPASINVPAVRTERYTMVNHNVVLIDPDTRQVVRIIQQP